MLVQSGARTLNLPHSRLDSGLTRRCGIQSLPSGRESVEKVWQLLETEAREGETGSSVIGTKTMTTTTYGRSLEAKGGEICLR